MKLEEVCHIGSGGTPSRAKSEYYSGNIPWAKISDIENSENGVLVDTEEKITEEGLKSIGNRIFPKGTLLFAMYGSIGKVAIAGIEVSTNQAILGIRPKKEDSIHLPYLRIWFEANKQKMIDRGRGGTLKNLSATIIRNLDVPLPSLPEQKHIAEVLSKAEALIAERKQSIQVLDEYLKSTFLEMFGDPVKNEKGWEKDQIGNKCKVTKLAGYEYTKYIKYADEGDIIVVKGLNVKNGRLKLDSMSYIDKATSDFLIRSKLFKGDVVMTYIGINIGDVAIIEDNEKFHLAPNVSKITPIDFKEVNSFYLMHYLMYNKRLFLKGTTDTAKPALNMGEIRKIELVIPDIKLQEKFERICHIVEKLKTESKDHLQSLEQMYGALSQRAFKGELKTSVTKTKEKV